MNSLITKSRLSSSTCNVLKRYSSDQKYQYIQNSKIPTMHFQKSLPRLPIPALENTCDRYLAAQRPILNDEKYKKTENLVNEFKSSSGKKLHDLLVEDDKNNKHTSYISEPWFDMYLRDRTPLPINYNPVLVFENHPKPEYDTQLLKATNMLISSLRFMKSLRKGILEPEVFHMNAKKSDTKLFRLVTSALPAAVSWYGAYMFNAYPLDMSQYYNLFNSTRVPETDKDRIYQDTTAKHVVVMRNGNFFIFDALDAEGNILPPNVLQSCLSHILNDTSAPAEFPLGILTTENRNTWAAVRRHLIEAGNENFLKLVDSSLFNIVLDNEEMNKDPYKMMRHFLHGDGKNRWFDKSFSLLFAKDGVGAVNFEHSWGDGVAVLRYFQDIYRDSIDNPNVHPDSKYDASGINEKVTKLNINYNDKIKSAVSEAIKRYKSTCESLAIHYILTDGIGKNLCKKHSISPDAVMQLGFQAAFYKQTRSFVASYESCSTAAFKHGRTETIRPCTFATKAYCEAINNANKPSQEVLYNMIRECSKVHGKLTKEAAMGQGFDRHLFAMKHLAQKRGLDVPEFYKDPAFDAINKNIISTSTLSSPAVQAGGFGPVVSNGYGIGYMIRDDSLGTLVTSYPARDGADYVKCLEKSYDEIRNILVAK